MKADEDSARLRSLDSSSYGGNVDEGKIIIIIIIYSSRSSLGSRVE